MAGCSRSVASCCTCASCSSRPCTAGTTRSQSTGEKTHTPQTSFCGLRLFLSSFPPAVPFPGSAFCTPTDQLSADLLRLFCGLRPFLSSFPLLYFSRLGFLYGPFSISVEDGHWSFHAQEGISAPRRKAQKPQKAADENRSLVAAVLILTAILSRSFYGHFR